MNVKSLKRKRIAASKHGELCRDELKKFVEARPDKTLIIDPDKDAIEVLVWHEDEVQTRSHDVVSIRVDDDDALIFTDQYGDEFDQTELNYTSVVYPYILEIILGEY